MSTDTSMEPATSAAKVDSEAPVTVAADTEMGEAPKADRELTDRERAAVRQSASLSLYRNLCYTSSHYICSRVLLCRLEPSL